MIRPEIIAWAQRWRECLTGLGIAALGLWAGLEAGWLLAILGWVALISGLALAVAGVQRVRFRAGAGEGPGIVKVTEGQIAYFGPLDGGVVAMDLLTELVFDPQSHPPVWILRHDGGRPVHIPVTASGGEALFDAFERLPGLDMARLLALRDAPGDAPVSLWRVSAARQLARPDG